MTLRYKLYVLSLLAGSFCFGLAQPAVQPPAHPAGHYYVNDYAGRLTETDKNLLEKLSEEYYGKKRIRVFIVTVHGLGNKSRETYTEYLRDYIEDLKTAWEEKPADPDSPVQTRGMIILFWDTKTDSFQISVEKGLIFDLPQETVEAIKKKVIAPLFAKGYQTIAFFSAFECIQNDALVIPEPTSTWSRIKELDPLSTLIALLLMTASAFLTNKFYWKPRREKYKEIRDMIKEVDLSLTDLKKIQSNDFRLKDRIEYETTLFKERLSNTQATAKEHRHNLSALNEIFIRAVALKNEVLRFHEEVTNKNENTH